MSRTLLAENQLKEDIKTYIMRRKLKDITEYREFQNLLEGLDKIKKILPSDHRPINRNMLQLHHLLKKSVRENDPYDLSKISRAYI